jgi:peptidoglycan/xylan/chitin deacetylase (PgdA/CDA1 family)
VKPCGERNASPTGPWLGRPFGDDLLFSIVAAARSRAVQYGTFVISLDFELLWGVRDKRTITDYGANIRGVREVVPALLDLFAERGIACTWATVGLLFFETQKTMLAAVPARKPDYANPRISSYHYLAEVGADEGQDPYHYGLSLIRRILGYPTQEIGTHTFSHFYCLEDGGSTEAFRADLEAARAAAAQLGISLASIVFPRNQVSSAHLAVSHEFGLRAFRGNERVWFHRARRDHEQNLLVRGCRLADSYLPLAGPHDREPALVGGMVDVPASRFLRPVSGNRALDRLRLWRITSAMETAARRRRVFHLWWHPHNFGVNLQENLAFLRHILDHFRILQDRDGMRSMTMAAVADEVLDAHGQSGAAHQRG